MPVFLEKSPWYVVTILAVMKAGGAYVPLDPKYPVGRIRTILESLGNENANLILTSNLHSQTLPTIGTRLLAVGSSLIEGLSSKERIASPLKPSPQNSCVEVFTSRSTGILKGIVIEYRMLSSSLTEHGAFIGLGVHSRVLQFAAHPFDISIGDICATLVHGGCICIPSEDERMNNLAGSMVAMNVNHANLTPTVAAQLELGETPSLKTIVLAGEAMQRKIVEDWAEKVTLINMYGPAEATVYCIGIADIRHNNRAKQH